MCISTILNINDATLNKLTSKYMDRHFKRFFWFNLSSMNLILVDSIVFEIKSVEFGCYSIMHINMCMHSLYCMKETTSKHK